MNNTNAQRQEIIINAGDGTANNCVTRVDLEAIGNSIVDRLSEKIELVSSRVSEIEKAKDEYVTVTDLDVVVDIIGKKMSELRRDVIATQKKDTIGQHGETPQALPGIRGILLQAEQNNAEIEPLSEKAKFIKDKLPSLIDRLVAGIGPRGDQRYIKHLMEAVENFENIGPDTIIGRLEDYRNRFAGSEGFLDVSAHIRKFINEYDGYDKTKSKAREMELRATMLQAGRGYTLPWL